MSRYAGRPRDAAPLGRQGARRYRPRPRPSSCGHPLAGGRLAAVARSRRSHAGPGRRSGRRPVACSAVGAVDLVTTSGRRRRHRARSPHRPRRCRRRPRSRRWPTGPTPVDLSTHRARGPRRPRRGGRRRCPSRRGSRPRGRSGRRRCGGEGRRRRGRRRGPAAGRRRPGGRPRRPAAVGRRQREAGPQGRCARHAGRVRLRRQPVLLPRARCGPGRATGSTRPTNPSSGAYGIPQSLPGLEDGQRRSGLPHQPGDPDQVGSRLHQAGPTAPPAAPGRTRSRPTGTELGAV